MGRNSYFQFKQFKILQEKAAMKVNTDGILLGVWVNLEGAKTILDVGTGTGLIALMLAQRIESQITAIEIDQNAADEAVQNVRNSKWHNRISVQNCSFQDFSATKQRKFDLIVSNPPFFSNSLKNTNPHLSMARHNHLLSFNDIIFGAKMLLSEKGKLALILPFNLANEFIDESQSENLFLSRFTEVRPFSDKEPNRCLMEFERNPQVLQKTQLSIYNDSKNEYSEEYIKLTRNFYLKF